MKKYRVTFIGAFVEFQTEQEAVEYALGDLGKVSEIDYEVKTELPIISITRRQMKLALHLSGLLTTIESIVSASSDDFLKISWYDAINFESNNPLIWQMAQALGKTESEVYSIFELGMTL